MTKSEILDSLQWNSEASEETINRELDIIAQFEERIHGSRGAPQKREEFYVRVAKIIALSRVPLSRNRAVFAPKRRQALGLARMAGQFYDEHGYERGDYLQTSPIDYVHPKDARKAPYHDYGGAGLALVRISRKRVYAKSYQSRYGGAETSTHYLVGRNESGTFFAHPVPRNITTVAEACQWIWDGKANDIIRRQGDIALIRGSGPKLPSGIPRGHVITGTAIVHATHPPIPMPAKGERIIVARRAHITASDATRD